MALERFESSIVPLEEMSETQFLKFMVTKDKHLGMKTQIKSPIELATLTAIIKILKKRKHKGKKLYKHTCEFWEYWVSDFLEDMVSFDRQSRKEAERIFTALRTEKQNLSITERLIDGAKRTLGR